MEHFAPLPNSQNNHIGYGDRKGRKRNTTNAPAEVTGAVKERSGRGACRCRTPAAHLLLPGAAVTGDRCQGCTRVPVIHQGNTCQRPLCDPANFLDTKRTQVYAYFTPSPPLKGRCPAPERHGCPRPPPRGGIAAESHSRPCTVAPAVQDVVIVPLPTRVAPLAAPHKLTPSLDDSTAASC